MNLVNTYLLLPLQRKVFKNFGHYDYQTSTFHLNEERVNEVLFDPAFNPFVDVLRETAHASAVASSKMTQAPQPSRRRRSPQVTEHRPTASPSPPHYAQNNESSATQRFSNLGESNNIKKNGSEGMPSSRSQQREAAKLSSSPSCSSQTDRPLVQLLRGEVRSSGLVSFLRQVTTQKSLAVESVNLVFSISGAAPDATAELNPEKASRAPSCSGVDTSRSPRDTEMSPVRPQQATAPVDGSEGEDYGSDEEDGACESYHTTRRFGADGAAGMAHSYSLADYSSLLGCAANTSGDDSPQQTTAGDNATSSASPSSSSFHTVGDLMAYLKQQLQGLAVGVDSVRLTLCIPPAATATCTRDAEKLATAPATHLKDRPPPILRRGTRVLHFSCRRGLRFSVDGATGQAVEDMACSAVIADWQGYLHVMHEDGPLPSTFDLDELIFTTTATLPSTSANAGATTAGTNTNEPSAAAALAEAAPITVQIARRTAAATSFASSAASSPPPSAPAASSTTPATAAGAPASSDAAAAAAAAALDSAASSSPAAEPVSRMLVDIEAAGGWSLVLTASQIAHLVAMATSVVGGDINNADTTMQSDTSATASVVSAPRSKRQEGTPDSTGTVFPAATVTTGPSLSARWSAEAAADFETKVIAAPLESGEALAAAALAATRLQAAAKYMSVHSAGCSVTLLTQAVVEAGVVARAWRRALPPTQLVLLCDDGIGASKSGAAVVSRQPVYESLASPHLTYAMTEVDFLFPNIASDTGGMSSLANRVFRQDRKKRTIYRNLFKNNLVDAAVTERLKRAKQFPSGPHGSATHNSSSESSFFLGVGSISFMEYRQAARATATATRCAGAASPILQPAQLMHAERLPYALVLFHRSTPPLPEDDGNSTTHPATDHTAPPSGPTTAEAPAAPATSSSPSLSPSPPLPLCVHRETIVVGLASIAVQVDVELLDVLATYAATLTALSQKAGGRVSDKAEDTKPATKKRSSPCSRTATPPLVTPAAAAASASAPGTVRTCSSVKVLLESLEASARYVLPGVAKTDTTIPPETPPLDAMPSLLARLLQRMRETSLQAHRQLRVELARRLRKQPQQPVASGKPAGTTDRGAPRAVLEELGFPEDLHGSARFLPECMRFSLKDLQVVHTPSAPAIEGPVFEVFPAGIKSIRPTPSPQPACTSVKWREAVVYMQDVLDQTKAELFRVDYSPEMRICVTHTHLTEEDRVENDKIQKALCWRSLARVLSLHIRLGDITTTVLTQDDYLLATYYVAELLRVLTRCRQRLRDIGREVEGGVAASVMVEHEAASGASTEGTRAKVLTSVPVRQTKSNTAGARAAQCHAERASVTTAAGNTHGNSHTDDAAEATLSSSIGSIHGTVAEAFAIADAQAHISELPQARRHNTSCDDRQQQDSGIHNVKQIKNASIAEQVPGLWDSLDTTCTAFDVRIARVRLGLFAPRLSPMGQVVGDPLFRCLPKAQRRQITDMTCLYHLYMMEVAQVSLTGLMGDGALVQAGQESFVRVRLGAFSMWERRPSASATPTGAPPAKDARGHMATDAGLNTVATAPSPASFSPSGDARRQSSGSASSDLKDGITGNETSVRRDLAYYLSGQLTPSHSSPRTGTCNASDNRNGSGSLVQLVQSYTDMGAEEEPMEEAEAAAESAADVQVGTTAMGRGSQDADVLWSVWSGYLGALERRAFEQPAKGSNGNTASPLSIPNSGVCQIQLLESAPPQDRESGVSVGAKPKTRHVWIQLTGLGLHHVVAYNGDNMTAVLKNYFSPGDAAGSPSTVSDLAIPTEAASTTEVRLDLVNLMATYRPGGVGRSLAVVLLPHASVLVEAPAMAEGFRSFAKELRALQLDESMKLAQATHAQNTTAPPQAAASLLLQAQAWLHTSLPVYVCNDCDVGALAREVLDPADDGGADWGEDLEGAGFVRLCEVISTAPAVAATATSFHAARHSGRSQRVEPNLTVTVPASETEVAAAAAAAPEQQEQQGLTDAERTFNSEGQTLSAAKPGVSVQMRYLELSAFMAKDTFDVVSELAQTWSTGADLETTDPPAALVMRSGPGFEWVAEEVARSCAPMTFRLNPTLTMMCGAAGDDVNQYDASSLVFASQQQRLGSERSGMRHVTSVEDAYFFPPLLRHPSSPSLQLLYTPSSPSAAPVTAAAATAAANSSNPWPNLSASTLNGYGHSRWRDALHAVQGQDQQLCDAYQTRVSQLLDVATPWVPVRQAPTTDADASRQQSSTAGDQRTASAEKAPPPPQRVTYGAAEAISVSSDEDDYRDGVAETVAEAALGTSKSYNVWSAASQDQHATFFAPALSQNQPVDVSSLSSSFSALSDLETAAAPLHWHVVLDEDDANLAYSEAVWRRTTAAASAASGRTKQGNNELDEQNDEDDESYEFDLFEACERVPHFLSWWSRIRDANPSPSRAVNLTQLDRTDDALLHDTAEKCLYPPVELEFFLCDCALHVSLYEGTDLMAAAVRKQRRGYLQIVSRGARVAQAAPQSATRRRLSPQEAVNTAGSSTPQTIRLGGPREQQQRRRALTSYLAPDNDTAAPQLVLQASEAEYAATIGESSTSCLNRLNERGCRSGFGDRDASKRLVFSCRGIAMQLDAFPQASEEDVWFHVVLGEATVFDCIDTSDVHRLLTATPQPDTPSAGLPPSSFHARAHTGTRHAAEPTFVAHAHGHRQPLPLPSGEHRGEGPSGGNSSRVGQLELTGLLTSSKSVHEATSRESADPARAAFAVSHFQQGGSELSLAVRLQPTSLTWSGASVDFAQSFFLSSSSSSTDSGNANVASAGSMDATPGVTPFSTGHARSATAPLSSTTPAATASTVPPLSSDDGTISGTEPLPIFFRRIVILPTTLTVAGSFQSDKGVLAALAEGNSLDALRSVPVLSWIAVQAIPLPIPFMRIEDCSSGAALLQRIVEDSNCISVRFLLTACCCGLQPLSAVARVGEAAKGLLLLPLSKYRGAALHHAIRTASSVFMEELVTQTSGVAALLASGSYHASRSLLEVLVSPPDRMGGARLNEPSRAAQPVGVADGWRQGQEQLRVAVQEALTMASYCTGPDGSLLRLPAAALRMLMGVSGAATTTLWGVRNSQTSVIREHDERVYKK